MNIQDAFNGILEHDLIEDRLEYMPDELQSAYDLWSDREANALHAMIQAYQFDMSIQAYFAMRLEGHQIAAECRADDMPINCPCGADCAAAINGAAALLGHLRAAHGEHLPDSARAIVWACERIVSCYICG
jgi:hypothetical protein